MTMRSSRRPGHLHGTWRYSARRLGGCLLAAALLAASTAAGQTTATAADDGRRHLELADYLSWETVGDPRISPDGTTVVVTGDRDGPDHIVISVSDEGVGIPSDELERLFNRFFRASTSTGISGTGIGLHMFDQELLQK